MEFITMKLKELNPAGYNPRKILEPGDVEYEQIKQSILEFGMVEPIVWNRQTGNVVGGHQRLTVLHDLGQESVEVSVVDLSEAQEKALNIALNKISGEWDDDKLATLLDELTAESDEMLVSLTGFTDEELEEMLGLGEGKIDSAPDSYVEEETPPNREAHFNYKEQFGVIVLCEDEAEQKDIYEQLIAQGFSCRVVAT